MNRSFLSILALLALMAGFTTAAVAQEELDLSGSQLEETDFQARPRPGPGPGPRPGPGPYPGPYPGPGPGYPPPPPPPPPPPYYPPTPPPSYGSDLVQQYLNQYYVGSNILALRQILGLGEQYRGRVVEYVVLRARTDAGHGQAQLLINGYRVGMAQTVGTYTTDYYFYPDRSGATLGDYIQQLQLAIDGRFTVESVGVKLGRGYGGGNPGYPGRETAYIGRNFRQERLMLSNYLNLSRFNGARVRSITIRASTAAGQGDATLCMRTCATAQNVSTITRDYTFPVYGEVVDYNSHNWFFDLRGNFWVESISIELDRY